MTLQANEAVSAAAAAAAQQLAELEAIYRDVPIGLAVLDRQLRYLRINDRLAEINGIPAAMHIGRTLRELLPQLADTVESIAQRVFETGEPVADVPLAAETAARPGVVRHFVEQWYPLRDPTGVVIGINVVVEEVTERLNAQEALRASEARLRRVTNVPGVGVLLFHAATGTLRDANDAFLHMTGYSRRQVEAGELTWRVMTPPEHVAESEAQMEGFARTGRIGPYEKEYLLADGSRSWMLFAGAALDDDFVVEYCIDISDRHRAEAARREAEAGRERLLRESERARERADRLQALTAALAATTTPAEVAEVVVAQGVAATGAATGMLALREAAASPSAEGTGMGVLVRHHGVSPLVSEGYARFPLTKPGPIAQCLRTGAAIFVENRAALDAGFPEVPHVWDSMGTEAVAAVPLTVAGDVVGAMSFSWTAPRALPEADRELFQALGRQAAQALERARLFEAERTARAEAEAARAAAEAANRAKGEFLAVMSHELRTPLNAIGGYAELMEIGIRGPVNEQQRADLRRIQASQRHLLALINQVLNYARVDAGAVRYDIVDVRVSEAIAAAEGLVLPQARVRGLGYGLGSVPLDLMVRADREKLQQILLNLLSNAIKFTEPGGEVRVSCTARGASVAIAISDTGIGIPSEKLSTIFEPFVQVDQRLTRPHDGVGLGLAISRDLARGMRGDLTAESRIGEGSTFTLTLPIA